MRYSFVFETDRCTGCQACQLACTIENALEPDRSWRRIYTFNEQRLSDIPLFHLSLACNHCAEPECMEACPASAYSKDEVTGAVLIDPGKCIGCGYCNWACPYDVPRYDPAAGVMTKCTFCNDRIHRGLAPACAELCPTGALRFDRLEESALVHDVVGFPQTDLGPAIRIVPPRGLRPEPEVATAIDEAPRRAPLERSSRPRVSLRSEWSLAAFTLLASVLFASFVAAFAGAVEVPAVGFLSASIVGMLLATVHLGRKTRAWRALLGFGRSWLSREIVFFGAFVASAVFWLATNPPVDPAVGWTALALGLAALFSMDRVYRYAVGTASSLHSAGVLLTGVFLAAILMNQVLPAAVLGLGKLALYVVRKIGRLGTSGSCRPGITLARVLLGFVFPALLWLAAPDVSASWIIAGVMLGESIDRCEFYAELRFPAPGC